METPTPMEDARMLTTKDDDNTGVVPYAATFDTKRFRQALTHRKKNRDLLMEWIRESLHEGIDYGRLHVVKKDVCNLGARCENPYHFSKPSLWKPGAEKICGMMGWTPAFPNLNGYVKAVLSGRTLQQIILRCVILNERGQVMGEGIGARNVDADLNKSLKMAKKSAHIDATLVAAGLSEVFTQDMEPLSSDDDSDAADVYAPGVERGDNALGRTGNINLETHCPIGRSWKGKEWSVIDTGFLEWIIETITDKPDLVQRAQRELGERKHDDPDAQADAFPQSNGTSKLADHARAIANAKSITDIDNAWEQTPEQFQPALRKTYQDLRLKLETTKPKGDNT